MIQLKDVPIGSYYLYIGWDTCYLKWGPVHVISKDNLLRVSYCLNLRAIDYDLFKKGHTRIKRTLVNYSHTLNLFDLNCPVEPCRDICI